MKVKAIGIMSGTSMDGVDIAFCKFSFEKGKWKFKIHQTETFSYNDYWKNKLSSLENKNSFSFVETHIEYGH